MAAYRQDQPNHDSSPDADILPLLPLGDITSLDFYLPPAPIHMPDAPPINPVQSHLEPVFRRFSPARLRLGDGNERGVLVTHDRMGRSRESLARIPGLARAATR